MSGPDGVLSGKVALVTGGSSGIGRAACLAIASAGAAVVVGNRREEEGRETVAMIEAVGGQAIFKRIDVTQDGDGAALVQAAVDAFGRLDLAFNNAGIPGNFGNLIDQDLSDYDKVMAVNLRGVFDGMRHQLRRMRDQGSGGSIVINASVNGLRNMMMPGMGLYTVSKHALVGLTKAAALEAAEIGVRVNAVAPGPTATEAVIEGAGDEGQAAMSQMLPQGRMGEPDEIAAGVVWLLSDAASFVTGHTLPIDGGYVAS